MPRSLVCADLFSGAGGFSEGFRQAGFIVRIAVDTWQPAAETHEKNHPESTFLRADVLTLRPKDIGEVDVLIGSPPCAEFSYANRGGGGDISLGMRLVYRFFRFVYELQPSWWILENVPRLLDYLPDEVPLAALGLKARGTFEIPMRTTLSSAAYGVPQKRTRAFIGKFVLPPATHGDGVEGLLPPITLGHVLTSLGDPLGAEPRRRAATDPVYGFSLPVKELTDHFLAPTRLRAPEARELRSLKENHPWYGRMAFPDPLERPARTLTASQSRIGREVIVVRSNDEHEYRRLSVRESACVQGFPITYQWWGGGESTKLRQIGNAVPPPMSFALAREIVHAERRTRPAGPLIRQVSLTVAPSVLERAPHKPRKVFRAHIRAVRHTRLRVDVDNRGRRKQVNPFWLLGTRSTRHTSDWRVVLYRGAPKELHVHEVSLAKSLRFLASRIAKGELSRRRAEVFVRDVARLETIVPDATTLQASWSRRRDDHAPYAVVRQIDKLTKRHFPEPMPRPLGKKLHLGVIGALVAGAFACETANRGTEWTPQQGDRIKPDPDAARAPKVVPVRLGRALLSQFRASLRESS